MTVASVKVQIPDGYELACDEVRLPKCGESYVSPCGNVYTAQGDGRLNLSVIVRPIEKPVDAKEAEVAARVDYDKAPAETLGHSADELTDIRRAIHNAVFSAGEYAVPKFLAVSSNIYEKMQAKAGSPTFTALFRIPSDHDRLTFSEIPVVGCPWQVGWSLVPQFVNYTSQFTTRTNLGTVDEMRKAIDTTKFLNPLPAPS